MIEIVIVCAVILLVLTYFKVEDYFVEREIEQDRRERKRREEDLDALFLEAKEKLQRRRDALSQKYTEK